MASQSLETPYILPGHPSSECLQVDIYHVTVDDDVHCASQSMLKHVRHLLRSRNSTRMLGGPLESLWESRAAFVLFNDSQIQTVHEVFHAPFLGAFNISFNELRPSQAECSNASCKTIRADMQKHRDTLAP